MSIIFASPTQHSPKLRTLWYAVVFLLVAHVAGIIGLAWPGSRPYFQIATPFNLVLSATFLLLFHSQWNSSFYLFLISTILLGFGIEVLGVHTETIFGTYWYETTLGWKIAEVPVVIGLNWFILVYGIGCICYQIPTNRVIQSLLAASMMVALDYFIEPVAVFFDFWQWEAGAIPLQNYIGWFVTAWIMELLFFYLPFSKKNPLAVYLIAIQWLFFLILGSIVV